MSQTMEFKELTVLNDKIKWLNKFMKSYKDETSKLSIQIYKNTFSRFFVAIENGKQLGFVRITNHSHELTGLWSLSDAYVLPEYRSRGVLRALIKHVINNHGVRKAYINFNLYYENYNYYKSLGFTKFVGDPDLQLIYIFHEDVVEKLPQFKFLSLENSMDPSVLKFKSNQAANTLFYRLAA